MANMINELLDAPGIDFRVATMDYHPKDHISFASNHPPPNNKPFESYIEIQNHVAQKPEETMQQRLWPVHCVQGTKGAELIDELNTNKIDLTLHKGMDKEVEMYSAFSDSFGNLTAGTGGVSHDLTAVLSDRGITEVFVVGLAGDYCVNFTALSSAQAGFKTYVIEEGQRCVDPGAWNDVKVEFEKAGVQVVSVDSEEVKILK